jgi:putative ABC transport system substrate-binding protein
MRRRDFITLVGGAAAGWPLVARAQQPALPVVGFLGAPAPAPYARFVTALRQGLREAGYVEGQNMSVEYRWANDQYDRLPALAADLVSRRVSLIAPIGGAPATVAAKAATSTIPIVFSMTADPVELGLVTSLNRPGGNITGVALLSVELEAKRLQLLHEIVPTTALIGLIVNRSNVQSEIQIRVVQTAARTIDQQLLILNASNEGEIEAAFDTLVQQGAGAVLVGADPLFNSEPALLAALAVRHALPAIYQDRQFALAGGLISYGASLLDAYRQQGMYAGRVLKGEKPADLPVQRSVKFEMVVNLKTAKALGIVVPTATLLRADEIIE